MEAVLVHKSGIPTGLPQRAAPPSQRPLLDRFTPTSVSLEAPGDRLRQFALTRVSDERVEMFSGRQGYDPDFLGVRLELPKLSPELREQAAPRLDNPDNPVLDYTHFSIVMHKERRLPIYTVVNIDGAQLRSVPRRGKWAIDGRIAREHQLGNEAYTHNPIDRGHMVRRLDPAWGPDAQRGSSDTFVYTNAGLQHAELNQKEWLDLENHVLEQAGARDSKLTVYTGPVFRQDDPEFDNKGRVDPPTQIPQEFWKAVVWRDSEGDLKGSAFVLSQRDFLDDGLFKTSFPPGRFQVYQVPLEELEGLTDLELGPIANTVHQAHRIHEVGEIVC